MSQTDGSAREEALGHLLEAIALGVLMETIAFAVDEHREHGWDRPNLDFIEDLARDLLDAGHLKP